MQDNLIECLFGYLSSISLVSDFVVVYLLYQS